MFAVFQIENNRDYQAIIATDYSSALEALYRLQSENPETLFIVRPFDA